MGDWYFKLLSNSYEIGQRRSLHFLHDPAAVDLKRYFSDSEFRGSLLVEQATSDQRQNLALTGSQARKALTQLGQFRSLHAGDAILTVIRPPKFAGRMTVWVRQYARIGFQHWPARDESSRCLSMGFAGPARDPTVGQIVELDHTKLDDLVLTRCGGAALLNFGRKPGHLNTLAGLKEGKCSSKAWWTVNPQ